MSAVALSKPRFFVKFLSQGGERALAAPTGSTARFFDQFDLRLDTWPHPTALQKHSKTLDNGESRRPSSSIGRECRGQEKRVLQDLAPKRLKTLGHSPKLPEGRLHISGLSGPISVETNAGRLLRARGDRRMRPTRAWR
jgi:hypothetical protein